MKNCHLNIVPLPDPRLIPRYLIDQIKPKQFDTDDWYQTMYEAKKSGDIYNVYLGIVDKENVIKGAIWFVVEPLIKILYVNFLTLDKEYQGNGKILDIVTPYLVDISDKMGLKSILWSTTRPNAYKRYGFLPSKNVCLELDIQEYKDGQRISNKDKNKATADCDTTAKAVNRPSNATNGSNIARRVSRIKPRKK